MRARAGAVAAIAVAGVAGVAGVVGAGAAIVRPAWVAAAAGATGEATPRPARVLVISLPNISWADLDREGLPNIDRLVDGSAVADLTTRTDLATTHLGDAYVTIGAGTRSVGDAETDGDALMADERFGDSTAGDVYRRRTGHDPQRIVELGLAPILANNDEQLRHARVGALGEALARAGFERAVIANADGREPDSPTGSPTGSGPEFRRQAVLALADPTGALGAGRVDGLLADDSAVPFGRRLDVPAVVRAFDDVWKDKSVVVVEASDLAREDAYRTFLTEDRRGVELDHALTRTDDLVGRLLERVDLARDAVFLLGPTHSSRGVSLTPLAIHAPGFSPGLLRSGTTRRAGFVQLIDVAPTILDLVGVEAPNSMEGRPAEVASTSGTTRERRDFLVNADAAAGFRDDRLGEVRIAAFVMSGALVGIAMLAFGRARRVRAFARRALTVAPLFVLAFLPATFLARIVAFHDVGMVPYWCFLVVVSAGLAAAYRAFGHHPLDPLLLALLAPVAILVLDVVGGSRLAFNSVLGFSPTVAGRFSGFSNPTYALLAASALLGAVVLAARVGGRRGAWAAVGLLGVLVVVDGAPFLGSDVGGILSLVPAFGVTAALLLGWRIRWQAVAWCVIGVAVAGGAFALLDLSRSPSRRTHLAQLLERIDQRGLGELWLVIHRKLDENLTTLTHSFWGTMLPVSIVLFVWIARRQRTRWDAIGALVPQWRVACIGFVVLAVLGYAFNDSGIATPAIMLVVFDATVVWLLARVPEPVLRPEPQPEAERATRRVAVPA